MGDRLEPEYCPKCRVIQPIFRFPEGSRTVRRCQVCGFSLDQAAVLGTAKALGLPSPQEVKILCVDDDPTSRELTEEILRSRGYSVLTAPDGPTALEVAAQERPGLILLDIRMPGMSGFEVCLRLKAKPETKAIPVIMLTAMSHDNLNVRAFEAGAELALPKVTEPATLLHTVEVALLLAASRAA